jgi:hypothetical protein
MKREFVPYEQALALKELGFDEPCFGCYFHNNKDAVEYNPDGIPLNHNNRKSRISAPTFSQAFRWFREKHNLEYQILKSANGNYSVIIHKNTQEYLDSIAGLINACLDEIVDCYSYEEAEQACLDRLIKIVKNK